MESKAFARAQVEAEAARRKLAVLKAATDHQTVTAAWSELLTHTQRTFTKLRKATEHGPAKGWFDQVLNLQRTDEVLSYVKHARNADEHGIEPITSLVRTIRLGAKTGGVAEIDHLSIGRGGIQMGPAAARDLLVSISPEQVALVPVVDRGTRYAVPRQHLGQKISPANPVVIGELMVAFLAKVLTEAEAQFGKPYSGWHQHPSVSP